MHLCGAGDPAALESWLANHPKYKALLENAPNDVKTDPNRHRALVTLMLQAVRQSQGADLDTDVQVREPPWIRRRVVKALAHAGTVGTSAARGSYVPQEALGLLFNMSDERDKAIDCYRAAATSRPSVRGCTTGVVGLR